MDFDILKKYSLEDLEAKLEENPEFKSELEMLQAKLHLAFVTQKHQGEDIVISPGVEIKAESILEEIQDNLKKVSSLLGPEIHSSDLDENINLSIIELQKKLEKEPHFRNELIIIQSELHSQFIRYTYGKEKVSDSILQEIQENQQKVSFLLENSTMQEVQVNDLEFPLHPLEIELLEMIEGKREKPKAYEAHYKGKNGALGFYQEYYKKYIEAQVIYQDYLQKIDLKLNRALRNKIRCKEEIKNIIPTKTERINKLRKQLHNSPKGQLLFSKIKRIMNTRYIKK